MAASLGVSFLNRFIIVKMFRTVSFLFGVPLGMRRMYIYSVCCVRVVIACDARSLSRSMLGGVVPETPAERVFYQQQQQQLCKGRAEAGDIQTRELNSCRVRCLATTHSTAARTKKAALATRMHRLGGFPRKVTLLTYCQCH
jgi:hypothetical protein